MLGIIYSLKRPNRYEYKTLQAAVECDTHLRNQVAFIPIESINTRIVNNQVEFDIAGDINLLRKIRKIFLVDLGDITLANLSYRTYFLKYLERMGSKVINTAECILRCRNKIATYLALTDSGIPVIDTLAIVDPKYGTFKPLKHVVSNPAVLKPLIGSMGIGVRLLSRKTCLLAAFDSASRGDIQIIQRYVKTGKTHCDFRAFILGNSVIAGMKRNAAKGCFTTNLNQGGIPSRAELSDETKLMTIKAAKAVGGEIVTVDFVFERSTGCMEVLEVNGFARWEGLQKVHDFNIAELILNNLLKDYNA